MTDIGEMVSSVERAFINTRMEILIMEIGYTVKDMVVENIVSKILVSIRTKQYCYIQVVQVNPL